MKITDYLTALPLGEVVTNKSVLAVLKRKGLIYDYSDWGYLESRWVYREPWEDGYMRRDLEELFPMGNATDPIFDDVVSDDDYYDKYKVGGNIEYKGFVFTTQYLDGCFKPYLKKISGPVSNPGKSVQRRMTLGIMGGGVL